MCQMGSVVGASVSPAGLGCSSCKDVVVGQQDTVCIVIQPHRLGEKLCQHADKLFGPFTLLPLILYNHSTPAQVCG